MVCLFESDMGSHPRLEYFARYNWYYTVFPIECDCRVVGETNTSPLSVTIKIIKSKLMLKHPLSGKYHGHLWLCFVTGRDDIEIPV